MKVSVIGPGAMGCLFAARFTQAGVSTTLVDHRTDRIARMRDSGITLESKGVTHTQGVSCSTSVPGKQDLVLVCTKSWSTGSLNLPSGTPVLTLQGGLTNVDVLCEQIPSENILAGATYETARLAGEAQVIHTGSGRTMFGAWTTCTTKPAEIAFTEAGFDFELTEAPGQAIWERVGISAGIDPLTALLRLHNGELLARREARQLLRDLVVEAAKVAAVEGYRFSQSLVERAEEICAASPDALSPMLADVQAGRPTEIEEISGEILERATRAGLPAPRTRVLWQIITSLGER